MYDFRNFASNLKNIIAQRGINQIWLADEAGTTAATISRYISGDRQPKVEVLIEIARVLNVTIDDLLGVEHVQGPKTEPDVKILISCYKQASIEDRKVIWALLDKYMSADERIIVSAHEDTEKGKAV